MTLSVIELTRNDLPLTQKYDVIHFNHDNTTWYYDEVMEIITKYQKLKNIDDFSVTDLEKVGHAIVLKSGLNDLPISDGMVYRLSVEDRLNVKTKTLRLNSVKTK